MNDVVATLIAARELLSDPDRWIKGMNAMTMVGGACTVNNPEAVCWCAEGAIMKCAPDEDTERQAKREISAVVGDTIVFMFNDRSDTTHGDVVAAFDRAIEKATKEAVL